MGPLFRGRLCDMWTVPRCCYAAEKEERGGGWKNGRRTPIAHVAYTSTCLVFWTLLDKFEAPWIKYPEAHSWEMKCIGKWRVCVSFDGSCVIWAFGQNSQQRSQVSSSYPVSARQCPPV